MANLYDVAEHLTKQATTNYKKGSASLALADAFGRSAFNRYYYACFLNVRDFLAMLDSDWGKAKHKSVPELLRGQVASKITNELKIKERQKFFDSGDVQSRKSLVLTSLDRIASVMSEAYEIRGVVDYQPDIKILFDSGAFKVNTTTVSNAKGWLQTIQHEKMKVIRVIQEVGLV